MKRIISITITIAVIIFTFGCTFSYGAGNLPLAQRFGAAAITVGDSTVIPLCNSEGKYLLTTSDAQLILEIKEVFKHMHPNLQVINTRETFDQGHFLFIWLDHKPRKK